MLPTLYSKGKHDEIRLWQVRTHGGKVITVHGQLGGKTQRSEKAIKGKNIGRANETTPEGQAAFDARSMWNKKKDKGYFESIEEAQNIQVFLPMLAAKYADRKKKITFPATVQPKMDGVRALGHWDHQNSKLLSRGGKFYDIKHISEQIADILRPGQVVDGEVYIHGLVRQDINKLVKKHREEPTDDMPFSSVDLELWIYDSFYLDQLEMPWTERADILRQLHHEVRTFPNLRVVHGVQIKDHSDIISMHERYVKEGFEGAIIREHHGTYELANRSNYLIKYKVFQDDEFKIIGYTEGIGKFAGCVIWICETPEGRRFNVTPKGTLQEKAKMFNEGDSYIRQWLTVQFQSYSNDRIPEFPVGIGVRLPKDM